MSDAVAMYAKHVRFGTLIDGSRVDHIGTAVEAGRSVRVFTLADGRKAWSQQDGTLTVAQAGRRDLSAGPVRSASRAEQKSAVHGAQGRRRGDEGGMSVAVERRARF